MSRDSLSGEVWKHFDRFVDQAQGDARKLASLATIAASNGDMRRAALLAREACDLAPGDSEIETVTRPYLAGSVPRWHFKMLRDSARNDAYERAIARAVVPGQRVLDVGAGTGLLAMFAARAGATHVTSCESNPTIAEAAEQIVRLNGYDDRIQVVAKRSTDLDPEADMGGKADLLISEILSNTLLGEEMLPVLEDCSKRLLAPGARMIPSGGTIRIALAHYAQIDRETLGDVSGFDVRPFNRLRTPVRTIPAGDADLTLCSDPCDLFAFDFTHGQPFEPESRTVTLIAGGVPANGVAQWIHVQLDDETAYENRPAPAAGFESWSVMFYAFSGDADLQAGTPVAVHGTHDRVNVTIRTDL